MPSADSARPPSSAPLHLRVFLASPGDVADERALAVRVLSGLPSDPLLRGKITLEAVAWDHPDTKTPFLAGMSAQDSVIRSLGKPSACNIVVVILWSRLGSPIEQKQYVKPDGSGYFSGTEWEYEDAWQAYRQDGKPLILFYHRTGDPDAQLNPSKRKAILERLDQLESVATFLSACRHRDGSIPNKYQTPSEFEEKLRNHLKEQIRDILERREMSQPVSVVALPPVWPGSPFPGLRPFTDKDEPIFFGRGRETDGLIRKLADPANRFVTIVGASGSGKSSLVWAGLIPRLQAGALEGSQDWVWVRFTPGELGDNPFLAFAASLKPSLEKHGRQPWKVAEELLEDRGRLDKLVDELVALALEGKPAWAKLLLFIDQFEELLTRVHSNYQSAFVDLLAKAVRPGRLRTVVTIRADFYHRWLEWSEVRERLEREQLENGHFPLLAPDTGQLYEMINRPAERARLTFEDGLPGRILTETGKEPGALALLAFALSELWKARTKDGLLTQAAYESFEGVPGAIRKRAGEAFDTLAPEVQAKLGDVFRDLLEVDEQGTATRRRALLAEVARSEEAKTLVNALTDARLLVTDQGEGKGPMVEVAHEALFRSWTRLKDWIDKTSDDHRLRRQITQLADYWKKAHDCKDEHRWPDERVVEVVEMLEHLKLQSKDLSELEQSFVGPLDRKRMLEALDNPATTTTHEERATIGVRLALLGDTRPGVGLCDGLPDIDWCWIEGGEVTLLIRSNPDDPNSEVEERLTRAVEPFWMARYPVTGIQFQAFLQDCYRDGQWRLPEGSPVTLPADHRPTKPGARYGNHPADSVNWREAILFCHWLSARSGFEVRLPTEWEWQLAATGGDAERTYPWGSDWDPPREPWRANTLESALGRSTAVGMYPQGASPVSALDMSGNVREWCLNEYEKPANIALAGDGPRVVRGGSWYYDRDHARAASRRRRDPANHSTEVGFRLVRF
jgi:formylglycine-generating enzyme required for sulfatase activity